MVKEPVLSWFEDVVMAPGIHPLSLAARAMCLVEALSTIRPIGTELDWTETQGVVSAVSKLVREGHFEEAGLLLMSLECLVRPHVDEEWPLDEVCPQ